jgi:hypothetical protein
LRRCTIVEVEELVIQAIKTGNRPNVKIDLWDGRTAGRVVEHISSFRAEQNYPALKVAAT